MKDKKKNIIKVSIDLFLRYGIKSVSMDDISNSCGISKKTLYEFLGSKKELVELVVNQMIEDDKVCGKAFYTQSGSAVDNLLVVYEQSYQFLKKYSPVFWNDLRKSYSNIYKRLNVENTKMFREALILNYKKGQAEGLFRSNFNANLIADLMLLTTKTLTDEVYFSTDSNYSFLEIYKEYFLMHTLGILTDEGRAVFLPLFENINSK